MLVSLTLMFAMSNAFTVPGRKLITLMLVIFPIVSAIVASAQQGAT